MTNPHPDEPPELARLSHTAVWDPLARAMLVFGGLTHTDAAAACADPSRSEAMEVSGDLFQYLLEANMGVNDKNRAPLENRNPK